MVDWSGVEFGGGRRSQTSDVPGDPGTAVRPSCVCGFPWSVQNCTVYLFETSPHIIIIRLNLVLEVLRPHRHVTIHCKIDTKNI